MRLISFILLLGFSLMGCSTMYKTVDFELKNAPKTPDYSNQKYWAALPGHYPAELLKIVEGQDQKEADVFFMYPTLLTNKKNPDWNANISDSEVRRQVLEKPIALQASAWASAANLYAPFYRQAHYRIFVEPYEKQGHGAWELAYEDLRNSFAYYLEHYNQGKPIIIAAHSQGSYHAIRLLKEFFDGKPLQKQLVAAYLVGATISPNAFKEIPLLEQPNATGGFVSWNTYKMNKTPKQYDAVFKGKVATNPITWDASLKAEETQHKGVLYQDGKLYPNSLSIQKTDGLLWSTVPKIPKRFFMSFIKNYHFADVNLFWGDIQKNAQLRVDEWLSKNKPKS